MGNFPIEKACMWFQDEPFVEFPGCYHMTTYNGPCAGTCLQWFGVRGKVFEYREDDMIKTAYSSDLLDDMGVKHVADYHDLMVWQKKGRNKKGKKSKKRGSTAGVRQAHNPEAGGANPPLATNSPWGF